MPPNIIDIIIKAAGEWFGAMGGGLSSTIDILLKATPELLAAFVDIVVKATPSFGLPAGLSPLMVLSGFFLVLFLGWNLMNERG